MELAFQKRDNRSHSRRSDPVIDRETGRIVGYVYAEGEFGREIELFGGKYRAVLESHEEAWGFIKGVEAVLNHMISLRDNAETTSDHREERRSGAE
jgi:hypothetical protein